MFRAMAEAGAAGRPQDVDDSSWYPAAQKVIASRIARDTLAAFVVDDDKKLKVSANYERTPLLACAVVTLEDRLPSSTLLGS